MRLAPEVPSSSVGFEDRFFQDLFNAEAGSFWFQNRNRLIEWALATYFPNAQSMLEIGCGTGFVLSAIERAFPSLSLSGTEFFEKGLKMAAKRVRTASLYQMDARSMPFDSEFDIIGAFDVLEHIGDDRRVLSEMFRSTRPGGGIVITVPQHQWLWSPGDDYAHHERRYDRSELTAKVAAVGFRPVRTTSFISLLLPVMTAARKLPKRTPFDPMAEFKIPSWQNRMLDQTLKLERTAIRLGISFPIGGSLLLIARK